MGTAWFKLYFIWLQWFLMRRCHNVMHNVGLYTNANAASHDVFVCGSELRKSHPTWVARTQDTNTSRNFIFSLPDSHSGPPIPISGSFKLLWVAYILEFRTAPGRTLEATTLQNHHIFWHINWHSSWHMFCHFSIVWGAEGCHILMHIKVFVLQCMYARVCH